MNNANNLQQSLFLSCSWFWCIGGFFPALLIAQFGVIGFVPFFLFNVIGATAFGFVFTEQRRQRFLKRFGWYAQLFSVIVAGYHFIFISWISLLVGSLIPVAAYIGITTVLWIGRAKLSLVAVGLFFVTILLFFSAAIQPENANNIMDTDVSGLEHFVIPIAFGFLLAPYFDLTFHRAYADSDNPKFVFFVGFSLMFSVLLIGMIFAAPILASIWLPEFKINNFSLGIILSLLTLQAAYTTSAHLKELSDTVWMTKKVITKLIAVICLIIALHVGVALVKAEQLFNIGSVIYRTFLFIIGTIFPVILIFGELNNSAKVAIMVLGIGFTLGFIIGGSLAPFLSVSMVILAAIYTLHRQQRKKLQIKQTTPK